MAIRFVIRGESIQLDQLLKATGLAESGGAAKGEIAAGVVKVDGKVELRKRAQLHEGQVVEYLGETITLALPAPGEKAPKPKPRPHRPAKAGAPGAGAKPAGKPGGSKKPAAPPPRSGQTARLTEKGSENWPKALGGPTGRHGESQFSERRGGSGGSRKR